MVIVKEDELILRLNLLEDEKNVQAKGTCWNSTAEEGVGCRGSLPARAAATLRGINHTWGRWRSICERDVR